MGVSAWTSFGSAHAGRVQFVFCDGSIRSLSYSIDDETYGRLGVWNFFSPNLSHNS